MTSNVSVFFVFNFIDSFTNSKVLDYSRDLSESKNHFKTTNEYTDEKDFTSKAHHNDSTVFHDTQELERSF